MIHLGFVMRRAAALRVPVVGSRRLWSKSSFRCMSHATGPEQVSDGSPQVRSVAHPTRNRMSDSSPRQACSARIESIETLTPTVRKLELVVEDRGFTFQPGQWVDFFVPGLDAVAGFSLCSSPARLPRATLAVKRSQHPSAAWCFERATAGDVVRLRAGGTFIHRALVDGERGAVRLALPHTSHLLLVAGGVGINPFVSILDDLAHAAREAGAEKPPVSLPRVSLLYSSPTPDEFPFLDRLAKLTVDPALAGSVQLECFVTRAEAGEAAAAQGPLVVHRRRMERADLERFILGDTPRSGLHAACRDTLALLCGPPPMADSLATALGDLGVPEGQVWFERWW